MRDKAFTISIGLAIMATYMIYSYVTSREEELRGKYGIEMPVVVAKKNIPELEEIKENMVEIQNRPKSLLEPGSALNPKQVTGFIAMVPINKGETITLNKLVQPGI